MPPFRGNCSQYLSRWGYLLAPKLGNPHQHRAGYSNQQFVPHPIKRSANPLDYWDPLRSSSFLSRQIPEITIIGVLSHVVPNICHPDACPDVLVPNIILSSGPTDILKHVHFLCLHPRFLTLLDCPATTPYSRSILLSYELSPSALLDLVYCKGPYWLPPLCQACSNSQVTSASMFQLFWATYPRYLASNLFDWMTTKMGLPRLPRI